MQGNSSSCITNQTSDIKSVTTRNRFNCCNKYLLLFYSSSSGTIHILAFMVSRKNCKWIKKQTYKSDIRQTTYFWQKRNKIKVNAHWNLDTISRKLELLELRSVGFRPFYWTKWISDLNANILVKKNRTKEKNWKINYATYLHFLRHHTKISIWITISKKP